MRQLHLCWLFKKKKWKCYYKFFILYQIFFFFFREVENQNDPNYHPLLISPLRKIKSNKKKRNFFFYMIEKIFFFNFISLLDLLNKKKKKKFISLSFFGVLWHHYQGEKKKIFLENFKKKKNREKGKMRNWGWQKNYLSVNTATFTSFYFQLFVFLSSYKIFFFFFAPIYFFCLLKLMTDSLDYQKINLKFIIYFHFLFPCLIQRVEVVVCQIPNFPFFFFLQIFESSIINKFPKKKKLFIWFFFLEKINLLS